MRHSIQIWLGLVEYLSYDTFCWVYVCSGCKALVPILFLYHHSHTKKFCYITPHFVTMHSFKKFFCYEVNRFSLIKYVFQGDSQDQLTAACNARCREEFPASGKQQGICLMACSKPTREVCVATCGRFIGDNAATGLTAPEATQCGRACSLLCSTEPRPELTDISCCVSPPLVCGGKGTREAQVFLNDWI